MAGLAEDGDDFTQGWGEICGNTKKPELGLNKTAAGILLREGHLSDIQLGRSFLIISAPREFVEQVLFTKINLMPILL